MQRKGLSSIVVATILVILGAGIIIGLLMLRSQAQDLTANVANASPAVSIGTAKLCPGDTASSNTAISDCVNISSLTLTAGAATDVSFVVQVSDDNGIDDVTNTATGVLYHNENASPATEGCSADNNNCYRDDGTCQKITPVINATTAWFRCDYSLEYYSDHSDGDAAWTAYLEATDIGAGSGSGSIDFEVAKILSGTFPNVEYGAISLGFSSSAGNNIEISHQNNGNVLLDYLIALDDDDVNGQLDCSTGGIDNTGIRFDVDASGYGGDLGYSAAANTITVAPSTIQMSIDISQRTNDGAPQGPTNPRISFADGGDDIAYSYWSILVPSSGILGSCQEEIDIIAYESSGGGSGGSVCWQDVTMTFASEIPYGLNENGDLYHLVTDEFVALTPKLTEFDGGLNGDLCGLTSSGTIACSGDNDNYGELSNEPTSGVWTIVETENNFACALDDSGNIDCWGDPSFGASTGYPTSSGWTDVAVGRNYLACALNASGVTTCWGRNVNNQLNAPATAYSDISCGMNFCVGVKQSDGSLETWGTGAPGTLPFDTGFVTVVAGQFDGAALKSDGSLTTWGANTYGEVSDVPTGGIKWRTVDVGYEWMCGIIDDPGTSGSASGDLECWGATEIHKDSVVGCP